MKHTHIILSFICSVSTLFSAEKSIAGAPCRTLNQALSAAYLNNPDLLETRQKVLAKHDEITKSLSGFRPTINAQASLSKSTRSESGPNQGGIFPDDGGEITNREASLELRYNVFNGFQSTNYFKESDFGIRSSWAELLSVEQKIFLDVIKTFLDVLTAQTNLKLYQGALEYLKNSYDSALERHTVGSESMTQVKNAESKYLQAQADCQRAAYELSEAKTRLTLLTGSEPGELSEPVTPDRFLKTVKELVDYSKDHNPNLLKISCQYESAQCKKKKAIGGMGPSVDVFASTKRSEPIGHQDTVDRATGAPLPPTPVKQYTTNNTFGIQVSLPLYDGGLKRADMRTASEEIILSRVSLDKEYKKLQKSFKDKLTAFTAYMDNIRILTEQVESCKVALAGTQAEKEEGSKVLLDVLNAQKELLQAEISLQKAKQSFKQTYYEILSEMGDLNPQKLKLPVTRFDPRPHYEKAKSRL